MEIIILYSKVQTLKDCIKILRDIKIEGKKILMRSQILVN